MLATSERLVALASRNVELGFWCHSSVQSFLSVGGVRGSREDKVFQFVRGQEQRFQPNKTQRKKQLERGDFH